MASGEEGDHCVVAELARVVQRSAAPSGIKIDIYRNRSISSATVPVSRLEVALGLDDEELDDVGVALGSSNVHRSAIVVIDHLHVEPVQVHPERLSIESIVCDNDIRESQPYVGPHRVQCVQPGRNDLSTRTWSSSIYQMVWETSTTQLHHTVNTPPPSPPNGVEIAHLRCEQQGDHQLRVSANCDTYFPAWNYTLPFSDKLWPLQLQSHEAVYPSARDNAKKRESSHPSPYHSSDTLTGLIVYPSSHNSLISPSFQQGISDQTCCLITPHSFLPQPPIQAVSPYHAASSSFYCRPYLTTDLRQGWIPLPDLLQDWRKWLSNIWYFYEYILDFNYSHDVAKQFQFGEQWTPTKPLLNYNDTISRLNSSSG